jgi:hypothetical protein
MKKPFFSVATFLRSWWLLAFLLVCAMFYERGLKEREEEFQKLKEQQNQLQLAKEEALATQQDLKRKINSQSDQAYIELTLMKGLGLAPEDQQKVFFEEK